MLQESSAAAMKVCKGEGKSSDITHHGGISMASFVRPVFLAFIMLCISPFLHNLPLPDSIDRCIASALDTVGDNLPASLVPQSLLRGSGWAIFNPERYHGPSSWTTSGSPKTGFFEGWYYKFAHGGEDVVLIAGNLLSKSENPEDSFAFVMLGHPSNPDAAGRYALHKYPTASFRTSVSPTTGAWRAQIGPNSLSATAVELDLHASSTGQHAHGTVEMANPTPFPTSVLLPDINGWAAWLCMECKHGIVSLKSDLTGSLTVNGHVIGYDSGGGVAYIEKDWGSSFPRTWVWMQSSKFRSTMRAAAVGEGAGPGGVDEEEEEEEEVPGTLLLSVASIPFPSVANEWTRIRGFIVALWLPEHGGLYRFATYTGASIETLLINTTKTRVSVTIRSAQYRLSVTAEGQRNGTIVLHAPFPGGEFKQFVHEMLNVKLHVQLTRRSDGAVLFRGRSESAALELEAMGESIGLLLGQGQEQEQE